MKYSQIAKEYLQNLDKTEPEIKHRMITWGNLDMMEDLFVLFGGNRDELYKKTGCVGHHCRFKFVMDRLDRESKQKDAIFIKEYISYSGIINRPTRCFRLKNQEEEK